LNSRLLLFPSGPRKRKKNIDPWRMAHRRVGFATGHQAGRKAGSGRLDHKWEDVVGAGRDRHQRYLAASSRHRAVSAIAAERDDAARAALGQQPSRTARVVLVEEGRHLQQIGVEGQLQPMQRFEANAEAVGHNPNALDADRP
jgi:hypothetical protein